MKLLHSCFLILFFSLTSINVFAQNFKTVPRDYDPTEETNISVNTTYDFSDSVVKKVFVTVTNKSKKTIRVGNGRSAGAFSLFYLDANGKQLLNSSGSQIIFSFPLGHDPEMNQRIILKPGYSETFKYSVYTRGNDAFKKIKIDYRLQYWFMDDEPIIENLEKIMSFWKKTEPVDIF